MYPVAVHGSPALGELPEQHEQTDVDARLVQDAHRDRHEPRSPDRAANERRNHLRVAARAQREVSIEQRDTATAQRSPLALLASPALFLLSFPRPEDIAVAEQLRPYPAGHAHTANEHALQDQEPQ